MVMLCYVSLITCFSGQILAKLLTKNVCKNIDTLQDLEQHPYLKLIVWEDTHYHKFIESSNNGNGLKN